MTTKDKETISQLEDSILRVKCSVYNIYKAARNLQDLAKERAEHQVQPVSA